MNYSTYNATHTANSLSPVGIFFFVILVAAIYIYSAYCLYLIAQKTNTPNAWYAWVPILNLVLMLQIIGKSLWWILAVFIPLVNIFVIIWIWAKISEVRHRPWWWGILMIINPINLIILYFLAFKEAKIEPELTPAA